MSRQSCSSWSEVIPKMFVTAPLGMWRLSIVVAKSCALGTWWALSINVPIVRNASPARMWAGSNRGSSLILTSKCPKRSRSPDTSVLLYAKNLRPKYLQNDCTILRKRIVSTLFARVLQSRLLFVFLKRSSFRTRSLRGLHWQKQVLQTTRPGSVAWKIDFRFSVSWKHEFWKGVLLERH